MNEEARRSVYQQMQGRESPQSARLTQSLSERESSVSRSDRGGRELGDERAGLAASEKPVTTTTHNLPPVRKTLSTALTQDAYEPHSLSRLNMAQAR